MKVIGWLNGDNKIKSFLPNLNNYNPYEHIPLVRIRNQ